MMPERPQRLSSLAERLHWTVTDDRATFAPVPGGWRAVVSPLQRPAGVERYHVAVLDRTGAIRYTTEAASLDDAVSGAERGVLARNALRLVRTDRG
jgi:hypothetical protein